ncbi:MAG: ABC transporter substrate-binding protein [Dehalococcoidia bacterium]
MPAIRVIEAFRNLFYSPFYVTHALGLFEAEGLDVTMRPRDAGESVVELLGAGSFDVALTGIMRSLVAADEGESDYPVAFAEVNSRDGFVMLSRQRFDNFRWGDVEGHTVISFREPPTPWMSLLRAFKNEGVDVSKVDLSVEQPIPDAIEAFKQGYGDFIELPEPFAEMLISDGVAHLAAPMGRYVGVVPYSSFAATRAFLTIRHDDILGFTRALYAGQRWITTHGPAEIAPLVAPYLPGFGVDLLIPGVERYQAQETWAADPLLRPEGFYRLQDILREGGLIKGEHRYEDQVSTTFADAVMLESPGGA